MSLSKSNVFKPCFLALAVSIALTGCGTVLPKKDSDVIKNQKETIGEITQEWTSPPIIEDGKVAIILQESGDLPVFLKNKKIDISLEKQITIQDLMGILAKNYDVPIIAADDSTISASTTSTSTDTSTDSTEVINLKYFLPSYKGTLGKYLEMISKSRNVYFNYENGYITVSKYKRMTITIARDKKLMDAFKDELSKIASKVEILGTAGMMDVYVRPYQAYNVKRFVDKASKNSVLVEMRVGVVTVELTRSQSSGIDWSKLQLALGSDPSTLMGGSSAATTTTTTTTSTSANGFALSSGAVSGKYIGAGFGVNGVINILSKFGVTSTQQDLMMKTIAGAEVSIKSGQKIPYVSSVGVGSVGSSTSSSTLGTTTTATADSGVTLKITPTYDSDSKIVNMDVDLKLQSVVGMSNLSAGNQLGSLTQPTTQEQSFNDTVKIRPGQTAVVGGVMFNTVTDSRNNLSILEDSPTAFKNYSITKNQMFIVIRPTITLFGKQIKAENVEAMYEQDKSRFEKTMAGKAETQDTPEYVMEPVSDEKFMKMETNVDQKRLKDKSEKIKKLKKMDGGW